MSLKIKLPLVVAFLVLLSAAGVGYFLIRQQQEMLQQEVSRRGNLLARQLSDVDRVAFTLTARTAERLRTADSAQVELSPAYFAKQRILQSTLAEVKESQWVKEAAYFDWSESLILSDPVQAGSRLGEPRDGFTFIEPLVVRADTLGYSQVRIDPGILDHALKNALESALPILGGILAVSILLSWIFSLVFTVPITRLKSHALQLSKGELSSRVRVRSRDELGVLGRVFNKMAQSLERTYQEIQEKLVEIRHLFKMATEDDLTGCFVKRYFLELLAGELRRSVRYHRSLSLLMCDVDHFKRVNDTYGHPAGDVVLRSVARRMQVSVRDGIDIVGRYGGEEFAVMLVETDEDGAWEVAERIRQAVEAEPISLDTVEGVGSSKVYVTISIGVTTVRDGVSLKRVVAAADRALYLSKEQGRNRSTVTSVESV